MSLSEVKLIDIVKKQYFYKLKAYTQVLLSLLMLQGLAILFSFNGFGMSGITSGNIHLEIHYYSSDLVVSFTMLWGFITAILITTKAYRNDDFVFITNRLSSNLANLLFLLTASVIGAVTALLSTFLIKIIMYFFANAHYVNSVNVMPTPSEFLIGLIATILYVFFFCALGYFVGTLVQISKLFVVLLPALLFGSIFLAGAVGHAGIIQIIFEQLFSESSFLVFLGKIIVTAGILIACSFVLSNRLEVKS